MFIDRFNDPFKWHLPRLFQYYLPLEYGQGRHGANAVFLPILHHIDGPDLTVGKDGETGDDIGDMKHSLRCGMCAKFMFNDWDFENDVVPPPSQYKCKHILAVDDDDDDHHVIVITPPAAVEKEEVEEEQQHKEILPPPPSPPPPPFTSNNIVVT